MHAVVMMNAASTGLFINCILRFAGCSDDSGGDDGFGRFRHIILHGVFGVFYIVICQLCLCYTNLLKYVSKECL